MGIQGLIPFLAKASRRVNIGQFAGCCVAIDAYCWLHKGAYTCVEKLARGEPCDAYVHYCMKFVNMLLSHNIKPILVFDGRHLPAKAETEKKRRESRQSSRKRAAELLRAGRTDEARNFLRRCIDVTHEMALALIHECRRRNVDCVVAPYEADAQLAYLSLRNVAQIVITEDSDLVLFGCSKILFKMDSEGNGLLVEQERLHLAMGVRPEHFSFDKFRYMCILSGCDYLPSLPGIGLSKACKFILRTADSDIHRALTRLPAHLNMKSLTVPEEYRNNFLLADATFRHQMVFDPMSRKLVRLNEPEDSQEVPEHAGKMLPPDTAYQLALGNLNPFSLENVDNFNPDAVQKTQSTNQKQWNQVPVARHTSIWSRDYKISSVQKKPDPRQVERPSMKGKVVKKDISLVLKQKREQEDVSETCTDADLTSLYFGTSAAEPLPKRRRSDGCDMEEVEVEKENSPVATPTKPATSTKNISVDSLTPTDITMEISSIRETSPMLMSPVLTTGKSRRNPFFKQTTSESPKKDVAKPSGGLLDLCSAERKFSALSKFGRFRRTEIDQTTVVQSRFFRKEKSSDSKNESVTTEGENGAVQSDVKDSVNFLTLKDVSNVLNGGDGVLNIERCRETELPSPEKSEKVAVHKTPNRTSLLDTIDVDGVKQTLQVDDLPKPSVRKLFITETNASSESSVKSNTKSLSRSFSWCHDKYGFQKSKSITAINSSESVDKDYKNPFKKMHSSSEDEAKLQQMDMVSDGDIALTSASTSLSLLTEVEEELVDDPSPADSGVEICSSSPPHRKKTSLAISEDFKTVDEGFNSPNTSRLMPSPLRDLKSKSAPCRRPGLSKGSRMGRSDSKQRSLLSMFGFQKKSKLQHA